MEKEKEHIAQVEKRDNLPLLRKLLLCKTCINTGPFTLKCANKSVGEVCGGHKTLRGIEKSNNSK